jgi:hypothetical protein
VQRENLLKPNLFSAAQWLSKILILERRMMSTTQTLYSNRLAGIALILAILAGLFGAAFRPAAAADTTALSIVSVVKGESVTIAVVDMPANKEFRVLMNLIGTQGVDGTVAGTAKTDKDGSFTKTFAIPSGLRREARIAIRIEATDKTGWYAYNWFTNNTSGSSSGSSSGGSGVPTSGSVSSSGNLTVLDVEEDLAVDIRVRSLPASRSYQAWFDWKTNGGVVKTARGSTVKSDKDGVIIASVAMPSALRDRLEIRIRLIAVDGSGSFASGWFLNADSDDEAGGGAPAGYDKGIPYLRIGAVVKNDTVTVEAFNFPKKMEFDVYMDKIGTQAEDGYYAGTVKSGKNGTSFSATLDIPAKLWDREKLAIRFEAADGSGYYAYNWFNNSTAAGQ